MQRGRSFKGKSPPANGVEFEPSDTCPKNLVIFDQSENNSRVMFNPALAHRFNNPNFNMRGVDDGCDGGGDTVSKDDTEDIDALLSSDEDDDAVSTGRTPGSGSSCSSSAQGGSSDKRKKTRKMVRTLRGIIPGGDRMDTPAVLDEAVRYLKSLNVEAKKLGIQNICNQRNSERKQ